MKKCILWPGTFEHCGILKKKITIIQINKGKIIFIKDLLFQLIQQKSRTTYYIDRHCQDTRMCTSRHPPEYIDRHVDKAICTELFKKSLESFKRGFLLKF